MQRAILSSVAYPALLQFSTLSPERHDFRDKVIEQKMRILIFSTTFVGSISYFKKNLARYYHKITPVYM